MSRWDRWVGLTRDRWGAEACYGLVREVLRVEFGIVWPSWSDAVPATPAERAAAMDSSAPMLPVDPVPIEAAQAGDVLRMRHGPHPAHLGVLTDPRTVLHLPAAGESRCDRLDAPHVRRLVVDLWRPRRP